MYRMLFVLVVFVFTSCSAGYVRHASKEENQKTPPRSVLSFLGLDFLYAPHDMTVESLREKEEAPWD